MHKQISHYLQILLNCGSLQGNQLTFINSYIPQWRLVRWRCSSKQQKLVNPDDANNFINRTALDWNFEPRNQVKFRIQSNNSPTVVMVRLTSHRNGTLHHRLIFTQVDTIYILVVHIIVLCGKPAKLSYYTKSFLKPASRQRVFQ